MYTFFVAAIEKFLSKYHHLLFLIALSFSLPLFFYKLGQSSLVSWDEAWYAGMSRNILHTGDLFRLVFNGAFSADKPPGGIWITAVFFKLFGISAFTARLWSAIAGFLSLYILYFLGSRLFNRLVGFCSAVSLLSAFWFLNRARSGNLDIPLTFSYLLTVYLAVLASGKKKYLLPFALSLGYLALVKGIVFMLVLLPAVLVIFWKNKIYRFKDYLLLFILSFTPFIFWMALQVIQEPSQALYHITHSVRGTSLSNNFLHSLQLFKEYLHNGIGKWFWPGLLGVVLGLFLRQKRFLISSVFFISFSLPFIFSPDVQLWHLIPLYPFMILAFYSVFYEIGSRVLTKNILLTLSLFVFCSYFSFFQLRMAWYQIIDIPAFISDEEILSTEAGRYTGQIFIDGDFDPAGAFYADRAVTKVVDPSLVNFFSAHPDFLLITNQWRLDKFQIDPSLYRVLKTDRDKVLLQRVTNP